MHNRYTAHSMCKHPNKVTPPGEDWTQHTETIPCRPAELAARHERRRVEDVYCKPPSWEAVIDFTLSPFCAGCDYGSHGDTISSATYLYTDFETKKDQWESSGALSEGDLQDIQQSIDHWRGRFDRESLKGPFNNSYWLLWEDWHRYTAHWGEYVNQKKEENRQQAQQMLEDEMYSEARQGSRVVATMETSMYAPGQLSQLEESRANLAAEEASGSQSRSGGHHGSSSRSSGRHKKPDRLMDMFGGRRRRK